MIVGIEGDGQPALVVSRSRIEAELYISFELTVSGVLSPFNEHCTDGGVVANLFSVEQGAVDDSLVRLAQYWVEGLVDADVARRAS